MFVASLPRLDHIDHIDLPRTLDILERASLALTIVSESS